MVISRPLSVDEFQIRWQHSARKERSAAQQHFLDLCSLVGMGGPNEVDPAGRFFTFERGMQLSKGKRGFADVWYRGRFAWEYKGKDGNLDLAYTQLLKYREDLENPPLLIVSDMDVIKIHTNFTGTVKQVHELNLATIGEHEKLEILRAVFHDPDQLRPGQTREEVTTEVAAQFGELAKMLEDRTGDIERAAHFLIQILFCFFAEDVNLLPSHVFTDLIALGVRNPDAFNRQVATLFETMRTGGVFGPFEIPRFNGGLFARIDPIELDKRELFHLTLVAAPDWHNVEPAIFGTLFERTLDPAKRRQLGAHYTSRSDIERVIEPVMMTPLRRRWEVVKTEAIRIKGQWDAAKTRSAKTRHERTFEHLLLSFREELTRVTVLDPACGSGNFLYVALAMLKNLEKEVSRFGAINGLSYMLPLVQPTQLHGLEINPYARELAQIVIWIGQIQWMRDNGFQPDTNPVLQPLETIKLQDALLDLDDPKYPREAVWPSANFIVGNPPFLGTKDLKNIYGGSESRALFEVYKDRVPGMANLCAYWFERARAQISAGSAERAGLLATTNMKVGGSRVVLQRIKDSGDIFLAWPNEPWTSDGVDVRISIVGFDGGDEFEKVINGLPVDSISADLTAGLGLVTKRKLPENKGIAFAGVVKGASFEIAGDLARRWLESPSNVNGRPNADVLKPWFIGRDLVQHWSEQWIVDFGVEATENAASYYSEPFEYVRRVVLPEKEKVKGGRERSQWWLHNRPIPGMRSALSKLHRFLATPTTSKHRVFVWLKQPVLFSNSVVAFARDDDYFLGIMQSRASEVWAIAQARRQGVGNDPVYSVATFESFPLPWQPGHEPLDRREVKEIAAAAETLNEKRSAYLYPVGATPLQLKLRTLTNLYNERPIWLVKLHDALDRAVWAAYGWEDDPSETTDEEILTRLLVLNQERASTDNPTS